MNNMQQNNQNSIVAENNSTIKNATIKGNNSINYSQLEIKCYWYAAGAGFLGGILASVIANLII